MKKQEVFEKIAPLVAQHFGIDQESVTEKTDIVEDLNADSISIMEFVLDLEDTFEIELSDEDAENITTVGQIVEFLVKD
ncbi:acyl carrier protein [Pilibacter termitis]|uniref:Acyl carrier protein n=1 Tax=Pilibacter termitis TaxID=263852 RepID=A0A1T4Q9J1_9ENTE|nr:acyl carrier protein [Pilibacter termitis]SKA00470.1 acyl carrier protein [Pilibacter termitis]